MTKQEETIAILNSLIKIRLSPSSIHGIGVFAMRDIPKGTKLYATMFPQGYKIPYSSLKKLFPEVRSLLLDRWPLLTQSSPFMWPDTLLQGYMNHSDTSNYDLETDLSSRDIKKDEEITEDYRKIPGHEKAYPWLNSGK